MESINGEELSFFAKSKHSVILKFEDVVYKIKTMTKGNSKNKEASSERIILNGVSGIVHPGEMLAMMGPSGCGKTTLLTALGGRLGGNLSGSITYNGKTYTSSLSRNIGFVMQDDIHYPHLTVTETLVYTALLRLPNTLTKQEKVAQAEAVIEELSLAVCRNSVIGGGLVRGISGGERKRVSVGQEMLINPSLLFLDEPTSGLDSTNAQKIVATLSQLSKGGRTVLTTIHQPSSLIFHKFDKVLLLSDGNSVYFGKRDEAMDYFSNIGFSPLVPVNPADFLLDLANGVPSIEAVKSRADIKDSLFESYNKLLKDKVKREIQLDNSNQYEEICESESMDTSQWTTNWWQQFTVLLERGIKERRHESFSIINIIQILATAFLICIFWWKSKDRMQDQVGLVFFILGFWSFYPLFKALFTFPQERMMLMKERSSRMYRLSSFFVSTMVSDLPMELLTPTMFLIVTYWTVGLTNSAAAFFSTLCVLLLNVLVSQGIGLAAGAVFSDLKNAITCVATVQLIFMLLGGFYAQRVPSFISWVKYISPNYHGYKLGTAAQYTANTTYHCGNAICKIGDLPSVKLVGFGHVWLSVVILFAILILCRLIAYLALMRVGAPK